MSELTERLRIQHKYGIMFVPDDHIVVDYGMAADALEAQEARIAALESLLEDGTALLEVIKEDWVDYDHIYSIHVDEAKKALTPSLPK